MIMIYPKKSFAGLCQCHGNVLFSLTARSAQRLFTHAIFKLCFAASFTLLFSDKLLFWHHSYLKKNSCPILAGLIYSI